MCEILCTVCGRPHAAYSQAMRETFAAPAFEEISFGDFIIIVLLQAGREDERMDGLAAINRSV